MAAFKTRDNCELYYEVHGEGERTIILCPGGGCSSRFFTHNVEALSRNSRLVLWDFRGHGRSGINRKSPNAEMLADDIADLIEEIGAKKVFLAGWSVGGMASMSYVNKYGCSRLNALIVIDWSPKARSESEEDKPLSWFGNTQFDGFLGIVKGALNGSKPSDEQLYAAYYLDRPGMEDNISWISEEYDLVYQPYRICQQVTTGIADFRETLTGLPVPFAFFTGTKALFPNAISWYEANIPDATVYNYEGAPHSLFMRNIEEFNRDFVDFIEKHS